jgi:hypothetical protein
MRKVKDEFKGKYCRPEFKRQFMRWLSDNRHSMRSFSRLILKVDHSYLSRILSCERAIPYLIAREIFRTTKGEMSYEKIYRPEDYSKMEI